MLIDARLPVIHNHCLMNKRLLTTKEAAQELGVHQSRIYALINSQRLRAIRFGNSWMIKESDLEAVRVRKPGRPSKSSQIERDSKKK